MEKIKKNLHIVEYLMIFLTFIYIITLQSRHIMWLDELDWGVGILLENNNLKDIFLAVLKTGENLPFFYFTIYIVKCIFGYNEFFLILESMIISFIGIFGIIKISRKFFNKYVEFSSVFLILTSYLFIAQCNLQIRPYALLFCFSSWTLYFYLERLENENWKNIIKYGISMIFLMYSHWFGVLISLCYAFFDLLLFFRKKVSFKSIVSYIIGGLAFLPSFIILLNFHNGDVKEFGVENIGIWTIYIAIRNLTNYIEVNTLILFGTFITTIILFIRKKGNLYIEAISMSSFVLIFGVIIFSLLNPKASLVRNRYFVTVLPHCMILISWTLYIICKKLKELNFKIILYTFVGLEFFSSILFGGIFSYLSPNVVNSVFSKNSDYFKNQKDCYSDKTLIMCSYGRTWVKYYFENKGIEYPKNIVVVDPLDFPNTLHLSEVDLEDFEYCVKDGKYVKDEKIVDIFQYDTIYYFEEYRLVSKDLKNSLKEKYKKVFYDEKIGLTKLEKIKE